jgi:hypothetical protein
VELGKKLAEQLAPAVKDPATAAASSGSLTRVLGIIDRLRNAP